MATRSKILRRERTVRPRSTGTPRAALDEAWADALLDSIQDELRQVEFFTREDLLHIRTFRHVATQTRYRYVCESVQVLLRRKQILAMNRTDFCLPERRSAYHGDELTFRYKRTVQRLAQSFEKSFDVMDVVERWKSDPHLTLNAKRVAVRTGLRQLRRDGVLISKGPQAYQTKGA